MLDPNIFSCCCFFAVSCFRWNVFVSNELFLFKHQHFSHPCDSNPVNCPVFVLSPQFAAQMSCVMIIKIENIRDVPLPFIPTRIRIGYLDFAYWPIQSSKNINGVINFSS